MTRRGLTSVAAAIALFCALGAAPAFATTYFVSSTGSDGATGTAEASAWRTVNRVNTASLVPGDTVLFQGSASFGDAPLMPAQSGTATAPITFSSYGSGLATISNANGAVFFSGKHWLTFDKLRLTTAGSSYGIFAGSSSAGSTHITLSDSVVTNTAGVGIIAPTASNAFWTISNTTVSHIGDSGLILFGASHVITRNTITDTGWDLGIPYGKHGIYSKGPDHTISYNDISRDQEGQAVSIRFHGARVVGNNIHDTAAAIGFFDYDTAAAPQGTSYVYGNRIWNIGSWGFYYDNQLDPNGRLPTVDFVISSNTWHFANSREAVNASLSGSARVTLVNNIFTGAYGVGLSAAGTTVEHHNLWWGGSSGIPSGTGNVKLAPVLSAAPDFAPLSGSPAIEAGSTAVPGLTYSAGCDGAALSYCGSVPDMGAVESGASVSPLAAPTGLVASATSSGSVTLSWNASSDLRASGYEVLKGGVVVGTTVLPSYILSSLACGTSYSLAVRATGSAPTSAAVATTATTAACAAPPTTTTTTTTTPAPVADTISPTVQLTAPLEGARAARSMTATADAGDDVGIDRVVFRVDGNVVCIDRLAPYRCAISVSSGTHSVSAEAIDAADNRAVDFIRARFK